MNSSLGNGIYEGGPSVSLDERECRIERGTWAGMTVGEIALSVIYRPQLACELFSLKKR